MFVYMYFCMCIFLCLSQERERKEEEERIRTENLLRGNPLLNQQQNSSFKIKRRSGERSVYDKAFGVDTRKNHLAVRASIFPKSQSKLSVLYLASFPGPAQLFIAYSRMRREPGNEAILYLHVQ